MVPTHLRFSLLLSFVLAACGPAATSRPAEPRSASGSRGARPPEAPSTELEGEVSIVAWAGYIERGETDPNYDWVTEFEKNTSCTVTVKTAATSDEMVALMNEGGFDLVTASGDASNRLIAGGKSPGD